MTRNTKILIAVLVIVTLVSVISVLRLNSKLSALKSDSTKEVTAAAEVQKMVDDVAKHIVLPADEVPTAAIVSDLSKLKGQPFFERAQLGDVVLVYATSRRAVLWRPSSQKLVEVSAINFPSTTGQTTPGTATKTR